MVALFPNVTYTAVGINLVTVVAAKWVVQGLAAAVHGYF